MAAIYQPPLFPFVPVVPTFYAPLPKNTSCVTLVALPPGSTPFIAIGLRGKRLSSLRFRVTKIPRLVSNLYTITEC